MLTRVDGCAVLSTGSAGRMVLLDQTLFEGLPLLFDFLDVPDPERPVPPMEPEARERQATLRAWADKYTRR